MCPDPNVVSGSWAVNDTISGFENAIGSATGNDVISGTSGANILEGQGGNDTLTGGADADAFVFNLGDNSDTIADFEDGVDMIDLSATGLSFADLVITTVASGSTIVDYGSGDQIELLSTAGQIDQSDFVFV